MENIVKFIRILQIFSLFVDCAILHYQAKNEKSFYIKRISFQFVEQIANPVGTVSGQDERRTDVPPLTAPLSFAKG